MAVAVDESACVWRAPEPVRPAPGCRLLAPGTPRTSGPRARAPRSLRPGRSSLSSSRRPRMHDGSRPDDGHAAADERLESVEQAPGFGARGFDHARREIRPAAAERAAVRRHCRAHGVPAGRQHGHGGTQVLRLEVGIEGVGQQHDVARSPGAVSASSLRAKIVATPFRQRTTGGKARDWPRRASRARARGRAGSGAAPAVPPRGRSAAGAPRAGRAASADDGDDTDAGTRPSSRPCRRPSGIRACSLCRRRTARACRRAAARRARPARVGPTARGAASSRGRASRAARRA